MTVYVASPFSSHAGRRISLGITEDTYTGAKKLFIMSSVKQQIIDRCKLN